MVATHVLQLTRRQLRALVATADGDVHDSAVVSRTPTTVELAVNQVVLDITLLGQRKSIDVGDVVSRLLGGRVGRLDELLTA